MFWISAPSASLSLPSSAPPVTRCTRRAHQRRSACDNLCAARHCSPDTQAAITRSGREFRKRHGIVISGDYISFSCNRLCSWSIARDQSLPDASADWNSSARNLAFLTTDCSAGDSEPRQHEGSMTGAVSERAAEMRGDCKHCPSLLSDKKSVAAGVAIADPNLSA